MDTLYPIFYGMRLVTWDVIEETFKPHMHPEAWKRGANFLLHHGGKFGVGGGRRLTQPNKPGFAPENMSFHQDQPFPSGVFYTAWDLVVVNPGHVHRAPLTSEVPVQGGQLAVNYGMHMNVGTPGKSGFEPWHMQPIELDGFLAWVSQGRPDLRENYPIVISDPRPQPPQPPVPPTPVPPSGRITVEFTSRTLSEGSSGPDVKFFQRQLNEIAGQGLILDGYYGPKTTQAVMNWQGFFSTPANPLTKDGVMGPKTQRSIIEVSLNV